MVEPNWTGQRVSVRRVVERLPSGELRTADVVGDLVNLDAQTAVIETRDGAVEVPLGLIVAGRQAPPSTADELAVEDALAAGWRAADTTELGGWLLRASDGITQRANSVLPRRAPRLPLPEALAAARAWYAERGLPLRLQVPTEARRLLDAALAEDGWPASGDVHVMTARLDLLLGRPGLADLSRDGTADAAPEVELTVELADEPGEGWLQVWRGGTADTPAAVALLTRHPAVVFASMRDPDGRVVAVARGTVDDEWLGITCVEVAPPWRRRGLAGSLMCALWQWGAEGGARRCHVEVDADNAGAVALYEGLGYRVHHDYRFRTDPTS